MVKLSIIVPSIRPQNLERLYRSIDIDNFEMICIGPDFSNYWAENSIYELKSTFIKSFRSPNATQQQGLLEAKGDWITFASDDGIFLPNSINIDFDFFKKKDILVGKYIEGDNSNPDMLNKEYYQFKYHKAYRLKGVSQDAMIFNCGFISRKFMLELGGWDSAFEATTCAHADLGLRALQAGATMYLLDEPIFKCSHQPGKSGDHKPIHEAMKRDLKTFKKLYSKPRETVIDINNWQNTPEVWKKRFK